MTTNAQKFLPVLVTGRPSRQICADLIYQMRHLEISGAIVDFYQTQLEVTPNDQLDPLMAQLIEKINKDLPTECSFTAVQKDGKSWLDVVKVPAPTPTPRLIIGVQFSGSTKEYLYRLAVGAIPEGLELHQLNGARVVTVNKTSYSVPTVTSVYSTMPAGMGAEEDLDWVVQVIDRRPYERLCRNDELLRQRPPVATL